MSDKLKGQMRKGPGGIVATVPWRAVRSAPDRGRKVPRNWGASVLVGDDPDGDKNTSAPYMTHRGKLMGGDKRMVNAKLQYHKRSYPLKGNDHT